LGTFVGCEMRPYFGSKLPRKIDIFKDAYSKVYNKNLKNGRVSNFNYLHLLVFHIADVMTFDKSKFLNTPKSELIECFDNANQRF